MFEKESFNAFENVNLVFFFQLKAPRAHLYFNFFYFNSLIHRFSSSLSQYFIDEKKTPVNIDNAYKIFFAIIENRPDG